MSSKQNQSGFTIVELMIATAVFATMLVVVTIVITGIGTLYYRGITQSQLQAAVRNVDDDVATKLRLSGGTTGSLFIVPSPPDATVTQAYCVGTTRYTYVIGKELTSTQHVLWRDSIGGGSCTPANLASPPAGGVELATPNSRLNYFTINSSSPYTIKIGLIAGPDDLICSTSTSGTCDGSTPMAAADYLKGDLTCRSSTSSQFCATASVETTVVQRLN